MGEGTRPHARGRGSQINPSNRFEQLTFAEELDYLEHDESAREQQQKVVTKYYPDDSQSIVASNSSPDISFNYSINPYRGCAHGCSYCYARPSHEYLGLDAGLDFESKVLVKLNAATLFRKFLARKSWKSEPIALSGVTDCYQPAERKFALTRSCLEVALDARQPIMIITKNGLIRRDIDLLSEMASLKLVSVAISVTSLDQSLTRSMEPRTSSPAARLDTIRELSARGIPVRAMMAPIIPGLNDAEIASVLKAVAAAGAHSASYVLLRLPWSVKPVFIEWLERTHPNQAGKVIARVRESRGGELYDSEFGKRQRGAGWVGEQISQTFRVFRDKFELHASETRLDCSLFRRPDLDGQKHLF